MSEGRNLEQIVYPAEGSRPAELRDEQIKGGVDRSSAECSCRITLSEEELVTLHTWTNGRHGVSQKARVILAAAGTSNIANISRSVGVSRVSVYDWLERFRRNGLAGLALNGIGELTSAQKHQLEEWKSGDRPQLAKRAKFILDMAKTADLDGAAVRAGVSASTALRWRAVFRKSGPAGLEPVKRVPLKVLPKARPEELTALSRWAETNRGYCRRAQIILGLLAGKSIEEVANCVRVSKHTVFFWRRQFIARGLRGLGRKSLFSIPGEDRESLERMKASPNLAISKRAIVIMDALQNGDIVGAAGRGNVAESTARQWRRAFEQRGVEGLRHPKLPPVPPREPGLPWVFEMFLPIHLQCKRKGKDVAFDGETTVIASKWLSVMLKDPLAKAYGRTLIGRRLVGNIEWPTIGPNDRPIILQIEGLALHWDAGSVRIGIRKFKFTAAPASPAAGSVAEGPPGCSGSV